MFTTEIDVELRCAHKDREQVKKVLEAKARLALCSDEDDSLVFAQICLTYHVADDLVQLALVCLGEWRQSQQPFPPGIPPQSTFLQGQSEDLLGENMERNWRRRNG